MRQSKDFTLIKLNPDRALKHISNIPFSFPQCMNEIFHRLGVNSKSFITFKIDSEHKTIIIAGDDNGFSKSDHECFGTLYDKPKTLGGRHGIGSKRAILKFMKERNKNYEPIGDWLVKTKTVETSQICNSSGKWIKDTKKNREKVQKKIDRDALFFEKEKENIKERILSQKKIVNQRGEWENYDEKKVKENIDNYKFDNCFGVITKHKDVQGGTILKISLGWNEQENFYTKTEKFIEADENDKDLFKKYFKKDEYGTIFYLPCDYLKNKTDFKNLKQNIRTKLCYRMGSGDLKVTFKKDEKEENLNDGLIHMIVPDTKQDDNTYYKLSIGISSDKKYIKITPNPFSDKKDVYYDIKNGRERVNLENQPTISDTLKLTVSNITNDEIQDHHKENYTIKNWVHDNGIWVRQNNVILNTKPIIKQDRGSIEKYYKIHYLIEDNKDEKWVKTAANKSNLNSVLLKPLTNKIFSILYSKFANFFKPSVEKENKEIAKKVKEGKTDWEKELKKKNKEFEKLNKEKEDLLRVCILNEKKMIMMNKYIKQEDKITINKEINDISEDTIKRDSISNTNKHRIWKNQFSGKMEGDCPCCGRHISISPVRRAVPIECAHIVPWCESQCNDIHNLLYTCKNCNREMKTMDMYSFIKEKYPNRVSIFINSYWQSKLSRLEPLFQPCVWSDIHKTLKNLI